MSEPTAVSAAPAQAPRPPDPPRPVTPAARRQSWVEPQVRMWWLAAACVALLAVVLGIRTAMVVSRAGSLIRTGREVQARLTKVDNISREGFRVPASELPKVEMRVTLPDNTTRDISGILRHQKGLLEPGKTLTLRIDPADVSRWSDATSPPPLMPELMPYIGMGVLAAALMGVAILARRRVLSVWQNDQVHPALVVETGFSGLAPLSRVVRFVLCDARDRRVFRAAAPLRLDPRPGQAIWIVSPPGNPQRGILASLYQ